MNNELSSTKLSLMRWWWRRWWRWLEKYKNRVDLDDALLFLLMTKEKRFIYSGTKLWRNKLGYMWLLDCSGVLWA